MSTIEALLARVRADPEDTSARLVLADAWIEAGDRRGDLIQVQHALTTAKGPKYTKLAAQEELLQKSVRRRVLGEKLARSSAELRFVIGFVDELVVDALDKLAAQVVAAVASSESALLRSLVIQASDDGAIADLFAALEGTDLGRLARLELARYGEDEPEELYAEEPYAFSDDLRAVPALFPRLRELRIDLGAARLKLPVLALATLQSFEWVSPFVEPSWVSPLARANLPALERFALVCGDARDLETLGAASIGPLLTTLDACERLRELTLRGLTGGPKRVVQELSKHALLGRLRALDLTGVVLEDDHARALEDALTEHASPLERLTASVSAAARARFEQRGVKVIEPPRLKRFVFERYDGVTE